MKEQPIETERNAIDYSVGQRPIHEIYEPPNPIPRFRPRPKLHQAQPSTSRPAYPITKKLMQDTSSAGTVDSQAADSKKSN
jgi:hypothetical protein